MNIIIFGATGTLGRHVVKLALDQGHQVTAFARNPKALDIQHSNLHLTAADVLDVDQVSAAVAGHDAAIITLGAGHKGNVRAAGTKNIVAAMTKHGVNRLIALSSLGAGDSAGNLNFFWKHIMFGLLLRNAMADHEAQEDIVQNSNLDWVIIRPAAFTDGKQTGQHKHGFATSEKNLQLKISRLDVANFMLQQITDNTYLRQQPGLSY